MTSTMNGNGVRPSGLLVVENGKPRPKVGMEKGTIFDNVAGDLVFNAVPGENKDEGLVYEWREPTVMQLREMLDHDGRARSLEQCLIMPIAGADWRMEGGDPDIADEVDDALRRATVDGGMQTPMTDVIAQKAEAFVFRVSYHEKVWKTTEDNKVTYDKIAWRPPDTCSLRRKKKGGDLTGFAQWVLGEANQVLIDLPYADVYIHGARRDPNRGVCDLTVAYHNYRLKEKLKYLWFTYCEVLSLPRIIVLATEEQAGKKAANAIASLKNAGVAGIPQQWVKEIQPLEMSGQGSTDFQDAIAYLDTDTALSLMAGFSELPARAMGSGSSHGPLGSYALAESSQNFFVSLLDSYAEEMNAQVTNSVVADWVIFNHGTKVRIPKFVIDLDQQQLNTSFQFLERLLTAPNPVNVPQEFVRELVLTVAKKLGMDVNKIDQGITAAAEAAEKAAQTPQQAAAAPLAGAIGVGAAVSGEAQAQMSDNETGGGSAPVS